MCVLKYHFGWFLTSEKDIQPQDPFLPGNQPVVEGVKVLEDPVHQDVVRHLEDVVEELPEGDYHHNHHQHHRHHHHHHQYHLEDVVE